MTHRNILNNGFFVGERMRLTPVDRLCLPVPLYHCFGLVLGNLAAITHGMTSPRTVLGICSRQIIHLVRSSPTGASLSYPAAHFDPTAVLQCVKDDQCTALHGNASGSTGL